MQTDQGLFVSFDGVPRSGRKAQADRLAAAVKEEEYEVVRVHLDWGDTPNPKVTRRWLSDVFEQYEKMVTDVVRPAMARSSASKISCSVSLSMAAVGSSSSRIAGSSSTARAMASRCRWPPERVLPLSPSTVS